MGPPSAANASRGRGGVVPANGVRRRRRTARMLVSGLEERKAQAHCYLGKPVKKHETFEPYKCGRKQHKKSADRYLEIPLNFVKFKGLKYLILQFN